VIPEGITRSRAFRFNVARLPATPTRPSRGPWLAIGLCCPDGSSLTTASSVPLNSSPPLMDSRRSLLHPRKSAVRWESRGSPIYSARLGSRAASLTPVAPKSANDCCFLFGISLHLPVTGSAITLVVSRLQSSLRADFALMLRPASWLALLSRTFTFELSLAGSPSVSVEYDYVGKQSISHDRTFTGKSNGIMGCRTGSRPRRTSPRRVSISHVFRIVTRAGLSVVERIGLSFHQAPLRRRYHSWNPNNFFLILSIWGTQPGRWTESDD